MSSSTITIETSSRLHFGLMPGPTEPSGGEDDLPVRAFGGAGLMIREPGSTIAVHHVESRRGGANHVECPHSASVRQRLERLLDELCGPGGRLDLKGIRVEVRSAAPEHAGLGTGTQLCIALASALKRLAGKSLNPHHCAGWTERGRRSAIGVYGFFQGGFLVDGGKSPHFSLAPLLSRHPFPEDWPIVLLRPELPAGLHGTPEESFFRESLPIAQEHADRLCRLLLLGVMPAVVDKDFNGFAQSLSLYNGIVGDRFAAAQGGRFAHPRLEALVALLRHWDVTAVGQSSWGPTLFAVLPDRDRAEWLRERLLSEDALSPDEVLITEADNTGAHITETSV
ncbi:hypothetical protein Pan216_58140 [Planctomycetes bacterium Pan216]|uniref:Uncharacterized protein n=1 Tax=Kolteria novifilia TaxID=2527975 RepID=A0A518BD63_9BACT|nr:hypothetical protein Pan216_58140 [Planctomycetes bacterium Pan216]